MRVDSTSLSICACMWNKVYYSTVQKTRCQSQCLCHQGVRETPYASCNVLKALNPFANTCLVIRQVKEETCGHLDKV